MESAAVQVPARSARASVPVDSGRVGRMVWSYILASTLFFFVAGLLGVIMRESQANLITIDPNWFYSIMTAHGLGAFVSWAAFAVMGISFWVLKEVDFPMRRAGYLLAWATWWLMVLGTIGIVYTTVVMQFGASWVFLYPLPFHSANQWSDTATGIFSFSVLLTGLAIITWCLAILHTVVGPGLRSDAGLGRRLGSALGFGYFANSFKTGRDVPYPVLPLTVIGIDMIIATLPLAALLVIMIAQSIDPGITVDPLLAKNMLWFFGHPVVYLLLFPAVAIYYLLIPRFAKRELVAGGVVAFAWLLAVIVNVIIWAHHIYMDYPLDSVQSSVNIAMQPLTFSIVAPSAISLYSLTMTIWRSDFQWTPAAKFLAAALLSWLVAGLSGIVNATIVFDQVIHNTMWIVGHFHNMALLNIGLVVFAGVYAFLPELTGHQWYSEKLANSHLWLTVIGGYGMVIPMLISGLEGAPRRYAVMPSAYDSWNEITIPFVLMMSFGQVVFAYNLLQTLRGKRHTEGENFAYSFAFSSSLVVTAVIVAITAFASDKGAGTRSGVEVGAAAERKANPGLRLFSDRCASCHALAKAGAGGVVGPDLDQLAPTAERVADAITLGGTGTGAMPKGLATGDEIEQIAEFVAAGTGK